jgi:hypothetical protein
MASVINTQTYGSTGFIQTHTWGDVDVSGNNTLLLAVGLNRNPESDVTGWTADGNAMTEVDTSINVNVASLQAMRYLINNADVTVVSSTPSYKLQAGFAIGFENVDQTTPIASTDKAGTFSASGTMSYTGTAGNLLAVFVTTQNDKTFTASGCTEVATQASQNANIGAGFFGIVEATGSAQTVGATWTGSDNWRILVVELTTSSSTIDSTPAFEFTGTDPDGDDVTYEVQIDTANTFDSQSGSPLLTRLSDTHSGFANTITPADTDPFNSGERMTFTVQSGDALDVGTYYWRVRAKDPSGSDSWGAWSNTRVFEVEDSGSVSVSVFDQISTIEDIQATASTETPGDISVFDQITITEEVSISGTPGDTSIFDQVTILESLVVHVGRELFTPSDDFQSRASVHIGKFRTWLGDEKGFFGEIGVASNRTGDEQTNWTALMAWMLKRAQADNIGWQFWATGHFWPVDYDTLFYYRNSGTWETTATSSAPEGRYADDVLITGGSYAGLEFGTRANHSWTSAMSNADASYMYGRGIRTLRIPVRWEYLQPTYNTALDSTELGKLVSSMNACQNAGIQVLLDIHNYANYDTGGGTDTLATTGVLNNYLDFLDRLMGATVTDDESASVTLKNHSALWGVGLMNEPAGVTPAQWESHSQTIYDHLRDEAEINYSGWISIAIGSYSGVHSIDTYHPSGPWITPVSGDTSYVYEAHYYPNSIGVYGLWDGTFDGTYDAENTSASSFAGQGSFYGIPDEERNDASVFDQVTITEAVSTSLTLGDISAFDQITTAEAISTSLTLGDIVVFDQITIAEEISSSLTLGDIVVFDQITIAEEISSSLTLGDIVVFDQITITEDAQSTTTLENPGDIIVFDQITITEAISTSLTLGDIFAFDQITVTEEISSSGTLGDISVFDQVTITEAVSTSLALGDISVFDQITITEDTQATTILENLGDIIVFDQITTAEAVSTSGTLGDISVFDQITTAETTSASLTLGDISAFDQITITEEISTSGTLGDISVFDQITTAEATSASLTLGDISAFDQITITEDTQALAILETLGAVIVFDQITPTEEISSSVTLGDIVAFNQVTTTEAVSTSLTLGDISVFDQITITEDTHATVILENLEGGIVFDQTIITEAISTSGTLGDIFVFDQVIITEEAVLNSRPTITLITADEQAFSDTTPTLEFRGTDANGDDICYEIEISDTAFT